MKKLVTILLAFAAAGTLSCSADEIKYDITGTGAPKDGAAVYLIDQTSLEPIDSAVVSSGTFRMKGKADKDAFLAIAVDGLEVNSFLRSGQFPLFNDGKPVKLNVAEGTLTGSALNTKLSECDKRDGAAYAEFNRFIQAYLALPKDEQEAREAEFITDYQARIEAYGDAYVSMIEENMDNLIPVVFLNNVPALAGKEKFDELMASGAPFTQHPYAISLKRQIDEASAQEEEAEAAKTAFIGKKFVDLEEAGPDGKLHKLSEYVGKGKWVLVDFWASWCGPCKAEMPNVVAAYKKYHDKGFEIVGISFDREKEPWVKAIAEWEMPWIHPAAAKSRLDAISRP